MVYLPNKCPLVAMGSTRNMQESATLCSSNNQRVEGGGKREQYTFQRCAKDYTSQRGGVQHNLRLHNTEQS